MPIEMPKGLPFSVDTWTPSSSRKRHHFLTHAHKDHTVGISTAAAAQSCFPIYSTHITKSLVLQQLPQLDSSLFVGIEIGETIVVEDNPDHGTTFSVTAFDANHCPGAVMFLFEGNFGNILHTGDCRLTPECLQNLPEKYIGKKGREPKCRLDYVFLDCTFGNSFIKIPSKNLAVQQVINCIWKHPSAAVVYLTCDLLAQDEILVEVSRTFGSKVFVDRISNAECFQALSLIAPEILSEDVSSRFQIFEGFVKFYERARAKLAEARAKCQPEPLFIRPSAQWYVFEEDSGSESQRKQMPSGAKKDSFGVWHVCYSSHSSREELEWALQLLQPKRVVSTTPSCRAMELDYVKKHCLNTQVTSDDPLWKLMDMNTPTLPTEITSVSVVSPIKAKANGGCSPEAKELIAATNLSSSNRIELRLGLSPPSTRPPITLFGRARLALENSGVLLEEKLLLPSKIESSCAIEEEESALETDSPCRYPNDSEKEPVGVNEAHYYNKPMQKETPHSCVGSSISLNENLKKLYRSMSIPVPRPLPSLVKIMNSRKRAKRSFQF